ncbi:MAG: OadG family protein [Oscillospiraceae bacterium]|nr:OadG family protein [Oscillospiraceae bacterium]
MENITIGQAGLLALLGYAVVFFGLILLMILTILLGKCFMAAAKKQTSGAPAPAAEAAPAVEAPTAPGSAGQLKLYNVEPKTAAMVMAIVADKMGKPINELRFLSIKEVSQ